MSNSPPFPKYPRTSMHRMPDTGQHYLVLSSSPLTSFEAGALEDYNLVRNNIGSRNISYCLLVLWIWSPCIPSSFRKAVCMEEATPFWKTFSTGRQLLTACTKALLMESHFSWLRHRGWVTSSSIRPVGIVWCPQGYRESRDFGQAQCLGNYPLQFIL